MARASLRAEVARLGEAVRALLRAKAPAPPMPLREFAARYLTTDLGAPLRPESLLHQHLCDSLDSLALERGQRLNVLAPRGAAKSSWASFAYPLKCACEASEPYVVLTADTREQATKYLDSLRGEVEANEALQRDYPGVAPGGVWRSDRVRFANGVEVEALGTGSKIRGRKVGNQRPTLIINDDPQNVEHVLSALQRDRSWEWLTKDVCNAGGPRTNIVVLGTALHRECIVCRLQATPGWRSRLFRSVIEWPRRMDLWREWEEILLDHRDDQREQTARAFYDRHKAEMDEGAVVLWPGREPLYALMSLRAAVGPAAFGSEKQNDPIDPALCEWPPQTWERADLWFDRWPDKLLVKTIGIDPSKGRDAKHGDYFAVVQYGVDERGTEFVEADQAVRTVEDGCSVAASRAAVFYPDGMMLEAVAFQELIAPYLRTALAQAHASVALHLEEDVAPKPVRIRRLTEPLQTRKVRFKARSPGTMLLVQQLMDFPNGAHDDGPDAWEKARRLAIQLLRERGRPRTGRLATA
jgi:hypothetical protein